MPFLSVLSYPPGPTKSRNKEMGIGKLEMGTGKRELDIEMSSYHG